MYTREKLFPPPMRKKPRAHVCVTHHTFRRTLYVAMRQRRTALSAAPSAAMASSE